MEYNDLEWDGGGDDESFKSALASPLAESFTAYSVCVNPLSLNIDISDHSEFMDALSEEQSEEEVEESPRKDDEHSENYSGSSMNTESFENVESDRKHKVKNEENSAQTYKGTGTCTDIQQNVQNIGKKSSPSVAYITFNQDNDCIAMATSVGFQITTLDPNPNEPYQIYKKNVQGGVKCVQILHRTSLVAIVKNKTPRILSILHAKTGACVEEFPFTDAVRRVEMNKLCLVVLTASGNFHIFVYKKRTHITFLRSINIIHSSESARTMTNDGALLQGAFFDLSSHLIDGNAWLVSKSSQGLGFISVYKICSGSEERESTVEEIASCNAHSHSISKVSIGGGSNDNDSVTQKVFATASIQGTIIRVFRLVDCVKLFELQRGSSPSTIHSISLNMNASRIAVSSSKGTIHLFDLCKENRANYQAKQSSKRNVLLKYLKLKGQEKDENIVRSFARVRLKGEHSRVPNIVRMLKNAILENGEDVENVAVCLNDGKLFQYSVQNNGKRTPTRADDLLFQKDSDFIK